MPTTASLVSLAFVTACHVGWRPLQPALSNAPADTEHVGEIDAETVTTSTMLPPPAVELAVPAVEPTVLAVEPSLVGRITTFGFMLTIFVECLIFMAAFRAWQLRSGSPKSLSGTCALGDTGPWRLHFISTGGARGIVVWLNRPGQTALEVCRKLSDVSVSCFNTKIVAAETLVAKPGVSHSSTGSTKDADVQTEKCNELELEWKKRVAAAHAQGRREGYLAGELAERQQLQEERTDMEQQLAQLRARMAHLACERRGVEMRLQAQGDRLIRTAAELRKKDARLAQADRAREEVQAAREEAEVARRRAETKLQEAAAAQAEAEACQVRLHEEIAMLRNESGAHAAQVTAKDTIIIQLRESLAGEVCSNAQRFAHSPSQAEPQETDIILSTRESIPPADSLRSAREPVPSAQEGSLSQRCLVERTPRQMNATGSDSPQFGSSPTRGAEEGADNIASSKVAPGSSAVGMEEKNFLNDLQPVPKLRVQQADSGDELYDMAIPTPTRSLTNSAAQTPQQPDKAGSEHVGPAVSVLMRAKALDKGSPQKGWRNHLQGQLEKVCASKVTTPMLAKVGCAPLVPTLRAPVDCRAPNPRSPTTPRVQFEKQEDCDSVTKSTACTPSSLERRDPHVQMREKLALKRQAMENTSGVAEGFPRTANSTSTSDIGATSSPLSCCTLSPSPDKRAAIASPSTRSGLRIGELKFDKAETVAQHQLGPGSCTKTTIRWSRASSQSSSCSRSSASTSPVRSPLSGSGRSDSLCRDNFARSTPVRAGAFAGPPAGLPRLHLAGLPGGAAITAPVTMQS